MNQTKRVIARLDIKGSNVIKGLQLEGLRVIGGVGEVSRSRYSEGADEILILDSVASLFGRDAILEALRVATDSVFVPVSAGGGLRTLEDANAYFLNGADRVAINSAGLKRPELFLEIAESYGAQAVVASVEAKKVGSGRWHCFFESGREDSGIEVRDWIASLSSESVGEVLVTSVDSDGLMQGPDLDLLSSVCEVSSIPIIYSGGVVSRSHASSVLSYEEVSAVAIGSSFHYSRAHARRLKQELSDDGVLLGRVQ